MTPQVKKYILLNGYSSRSRKVTIDEIVKQGFKVTPRLRHSYIHHPKTLTRRDWSPLSKEMGIPVTLMWQTKRLIGKYLIKPLTPAPIPNPTINTDTEIVSITGLGSETVTATVTDTVNVTVRDNGKTKSTVEKVSDTSYTITITSLADEDVNTNINISAEGTNGVTVTKVLRVQIKKETGEA